MTDAMTDQAVGADHAPRVLVVEDEFLIRALVADHLRDAGFSVIEAFNGDEAVALLSAGATVELIFTDVRMPGSTDGMALLAWVRAQRPGLPVIVTSGHLDPLVAASGGAAAFVPKPFDVGVVVDALRAALDGAA
jgi:DNA-binding NtrC family response regulator